MKNQTKTVDANALTAAHEIFNLIAKNQDVSEQFRFWLNQNLGSDVFGAWLAYNGDAQRPVGVMLCELVTATPEPVVALCFWGKAIAALMAKAESWAKQKEVDKLILVTRKDYRNYKKYGFSLETNILSKNLGGEKTNGT